MTRNDHLKVTIRPVPDNTGMYVATFNSPVLLSTFCIVFPDSVTGAIALHDFANMLHQHLIRPV